MKHLIVISPEETPANQTAIVNALFDEGLQYFHLRKPYFTATEQEHYLSEIKPQYLKNVALHQHHTVNGNNQITRFHFKEHERLKQKVNELRLNKKPGMYFSTSLHDADEINTLTPLWDYVFLGPVFSSISKPGYENKVLQALVLEKKHNPEIIAIGGITPDNADAVLSRGYDGIAVLGAIWQNQSKAVQAFKTLKGICCN